MPDEHPHEPPRPKKCRVDVQQAGEYLDLSYSRREGCVGCFLLIWLTGWTVGCVALTVAVFVEPSVEMIAFATPFLAAWVFVSCVLVYTWGGKEQLRLTPRGLEYRSAAWMTLQRRDVPLHELKSVRRMEEQSEDTKSFSVGVETLGHPVRFASGISADEQTYLVKLISRHLEQLRTRAGLAPAAADQPETAVSDGDGVEVLRPGREVLQPPSDSTAELDRGFRRLEFTWRGRWSTAAFGVMTFINLFWNGIVSVFLIQLFKDFRWELCLFLIPFELIGLLLFLAWLWTLTLPVWRAKWIFDRDRATHQNQVARQIGPLGIYWTRLYAAERLARLELHRAKIDKQASKPSLGLTSGDYSLVLVQDDGNDLVCIKHLTEGEVRWMADVLFREANWDLESW